jgi:hypothetical protein
VGAKIFLSSSVSVLALWPTQPPVQWVLGTVSSGVKQMRHEAHHCTPSNGKFKNEWSYTSTPLYDFMSCRGATLLCNVSNFIYLLSLKRCCLRDESLRQRFNIVIIIFNDKYRIFEIQTH